MALFNNLWKSKVPRSWWFEVSEGKWSRSRGDYSTINEQFRLFSLGRRHVLPAIFDAFHPDSRRRKSDTKSPLHTLVLDGHRGGVVFGCPSRQASDYPLGARGYHRGSVWCPSMKINSCRTQLGVEGSVWRSLILVTINIYEGLYRILIVRASSSASSNPLYLTVLKQSISEAVNWVFHPQASWTSYIQCSSF